MELQTKQISKNKTKQKFVYKNGATHITLDDLIAPSHEEITREITKKVGTRPELPSDLPKGEWSTQAIKVLGERYLVKNDKLEIIETPEDMVWRVAWEVASAEARWGAKRRDVLESARDFYKLMVSQRFLPNSPTLMNAGTGNGLQYSACFVLPVDDSMEGIFDALKYQAVIHKTGGGTGFSFTRLRESGALVKTSSGTASGPVSFMKIFDAATNEVKQGGKRRGANMGILRVDHPDVLEFIHCKEQGGITNFNISVAITDAFMDAYFNDKEYDLISPKSKTVVGKLSARRVFDEIADGAWRTGDPGLIFIDRINAGSANPIPVLGPVESTNPCGEQPLYPYDACNLGSIFLGYFVHKDSAGTATIDWDDLSKVARMSTRFLDNVIEVNPYPLEQIRKTVFNSRRIGLGIGGWSDMLVELGIPFDSEEAMVLAEKIMKFVQDEALDEDRKLAKKRGAFPLFPVSIYRDEVPRRNSTITTIAPTGTISIIAKSSSGCEPMFAVAFQHIVKDKHLDRKLTFVEPRFEQIAKEKGFWSESLMTKVGEHGVIREMKEIPEEVRAIFGTAHEIDIDWHIRTQAAFQKYTENAVSKTINLRHESTIEDVKHAYLTAWQTDCKGITIFRDGSKDAQVLNIGTNNGEKKEEVKVAPPVIIERPVRVAGATYRIATPLGSAFITINQTETGEPFELFITIGKAGSEVAALAEALGRLVSTNFRFGNHLPAKERAREIMNQLQGIGGSRSVGFGVNRVRSLPDAVAKAIGMHFGFSGAVAAAETHSLDPVAASANQTETKIGDICPSCGAPALVYEEGCAKCHACGHSEC